MDSFSCQGKATLCNMPSKGHFDETLLLAHDEQWGNGITFCSIDCVGISRWSENCIQEGSYWTSSDA